MCLGGHSTTTSFAARQDCCGGSGRLWSVGARIGAMWSLPRRLAFRFGVIAGALIAYPLPFMLVPFGGRLGEQIFFAWRWLVERFADLIGVALPPFRPTGSGDTLFHYVEL